MSDSCTRTCTVADCDKPALARGYCRRHYYRWYRTGAVTLGPRSYVHNRTGYQRGCRCEVCVSANRENSQRWSRGETGDPDRHPHGDPRRYRRGCRCPECWNAYRDYVGKLHHWPLDTLSDIWRELADRPTPWAVPLQKHAVEWIDPTADAALYLLGETA